MSQLRVMTFNIAGADDEDDGVNAWQAERAPLNIATIQRYAPDLISFQELQFLNHTTYQQYLPEYQALLGAQADIEPYLYNAIYWKPTVCALETSGSFWLSETPDQYSGSWDTADIRVLTWARFRHLATGTHFALLNTHLDHISEEARIEGCQLILRQLHSIKQTDEFIVFCGDFNSNPWIPEGAESIASTFTNEPYRLLQAAGFRDSFRTAGTNDSATSHTYHGYQGTQYDLHTAHRAWRLDWILIHDEQSPVSVRNCQIIHDHQGDVYPSDHYPVIADIELP